MEWTDLEPDQRLTYLIGDIVRMDVFLELEARSVFRLVASAAENPSAEHRDLAPTLDGIKDTIRRVDVDDYARELTRQAVIEAAAAHKQRKGPVHDYWMHLGGQDERWTSIKTLANVSPGVRATPQNLDSFSKARDSIARAAWRMRGVGLILPMWLGRETYMDDLDDDTFRFWTATALGRFRTPSGAGLLDVDKDDTLPLPPGRPTAKSVI